MQLNFFVNDAPVSLEVDPQRRLLDILREDLELTGTKEGCSCLLYTSFCMLLLSPPSLSSSPTERRE